MPFVRMKSLMLAVALVTASHAIAAPQDHPLIKPYTGSVLARRDDPGHSTYKVVTSLDPKGKTDDEVIRTKAATGTLTGLFYENPAGRSQHEILANYKQALQAAGFSILFECGADACGPAWAGSRWGRVTGMKYTSAPLWYLSAKRVSDQSETYVAIAVMKPRHQIDILEVKTMDRGQVTVTAEALRRGLAAEGRVVLDGLFFDTDKAVLTPESKPALEVIAQFLQSDPALQVFIVGHTDTDGTLEHNMALSLDRARAVVTALTTRHAIAASRLSAHGVGPLSPARTNRSDSGKTANRRVEMVAR